MEATNLNNKKSESRLKDKNGNLFGEAKHKSLILLAIVDSDCEACLMAKNQMKWIQEGIKDLEVEYVFVSFTSKTILR